MKEKRTEKSRGEFALMEGINEIMQKKAIQLARLYQQKPS